MTSTTFSSKTFPSLYKWTLKRNKPVIMIFSILLALGVILDLYVLTQIDPVELTEGFIDSEKSSVGYATLIIYQVGAMFFTYISSLLTFSFLHNKRSVDMFGSLPTNRETVFLSNFLGGLTSVAAPYLIASLVVMGATCRTAYYFKLDLLLIFSGLLGLIAAYVFTVLIAYCCGTSIDTAIVTIASNCIFAGIIGLFWGISSEMIPGIEFEQVVYSPLIAALTPYGFCFFSDFYYFDSQMSALVILLIWNAVFAAAMFFLALSAAKKRKAEVAQNEFEVKWIPMVIKAGASVVCGGFIGSVSAMTSGSGFMNMVMYTFWYVIVSFAIFFILHLIFFRGKKISFKPSAVVYSATTVVALGIVFALTTGMGLDTYVPSASNVKSVVFGYDKEFSDPESIEIITEIHKVITEGVKNDSEYPYFLGSNDHHDITDYNSMYSDESFRTKYPMITMSSFEFKYTKKIGFKTYRSYYIYNNTYDAYDYDKLESLLVKLVNTEEYKRSENPKLWNNELRKASKIEDSPVLYYAVYNPADEEYENGDYDTRGYRDVGSINLPSDEAFVEGLFAALQKDILADKEYQKTLYAQGRYYGNDAVGDNLLELYVKYEAARNYSTHSAFYGIPVGNDIYVNIPKSYSNTMAYLEKNGIPTEYMTLNNTDFTLDVSSYVMDNGDVTRSYEYFGFRGEADDLYSMAEGIAPVLEFNTFVKMGDIDGYADWHSLHGRDFEDLVLIRAKELYNEYSKDPSYIKTDYTNRFISENYGEAGTGEGGEYFYMADEIIKKLEEESFDMITKLGSDTNASSDKETDSSKEDKAASDTDSKTAA